MTSITKTHSWCLKLCSKIVSYDCVIIACKNNGK